MASKFGNRVRNTLNIPFRILWTAANTVSDSANTVAWAAEDLAKVTNSTADKIRELFNEDKKWYQKILNVPVAAWVWLVSVVEAAVKPVVNWVVNTWKTVRNTVSNARKSTFWSLFSTKPVSDFSYNTRKTKDWVKLVDVHKRTMDPNKLWTSNRWTWKKINAKSAEKAKAAAAWAATAAAISSKEISDLKKSFEDKMAEMKADFSKKIETALSENKKLSEQNATLQNTNKELEKKNAELQKALESLKKADKPTEAKPEIKEKKDDKWGKPAEAKPEKKEEKPEKKDDKWTEWKKDIKDSDRASESVESKRWKKMIEYLHKSHPEIKIETDSSTAEWHLYWTESGNKIVVWTKNKSEAPQILLHEISHVLEQDDAEWIKELKDTMKSLNEKYGKQLFSVSNNDKYDTKEKKTIEDVCEIIAMYARDDWSFEKCMENLQSWENWKLAKISASESNELKDLCENIISNLDTETKTVKMFEPVSAAA